MLSVLAVCACVSLAAAHWDVFGRERIGAAPPRNGAGWYGECFLGIPDESASNLFLAEHFVEGRVPDFTFKTDWIDFPAGPMAVDLDRNFATMGDFFDDYITDVSHPEKLNEPFGSFLVRFSGNLNVVWEDNADALMILPVWVDFACNGYDGYRVEVGDVGFRIPTVNPADAFYWEHFFFHATGLYPVRMTFYNRFDSNPTSPFGRAGFELYSLHGGGLAWPAGGQLIHERLGRATIVPPRVIYQPDDIQPVLVGDFDTDGDFDLRDFHWLQSCFTGPVDEELGPVNLFPGCEWVDFDGDRDVDVTDAALFHDLFMGP